MPRPKKYAALVIAVIVAGLVMCALCLQFTNILTGNISLVFVSSMLGLFTGLSVGLVVSYYIFKNRGWNPLPKKTEIELIETY